MEHASGGNRVVWDGSDEERPRISSGIYFYRLQAGEYSEVKKLSILR